MYLAQPHGSNAESMYPAIEPPPVQGGDAWPEWKQRLSDTHVLIGLGFTQLERDECVFKRVDRNGMALYVTTPRKAGERIALKACDIRGKLLPSYAEIVGGRGDNGKGKLPLLAVMLLNRRSNSDIICAMEVSE